MAQGDSNNLVEEMELNDMDSFVNYLRVPQEVFEALLDLITPRIRKEFVVREPISARTRLQICLRYLCSGDSMASLSYAFRVGQSTVSKVISETCEAIWEVQ